MESTSKDVIHLFTKTKLFTGIGVAAGSLTMVFVGTAVAHSGTAKAKTPCVTQQGTTVLTVTAYNDGPADLTFHTDTENMFGGDGDVIIKAGNSVPKSKTLEGVKPGQKLSGNLEGVWLLPDGTKERHPLSWETNAGPLCPTPPTTPPTKPPVTTPPATVTPPPLPKPPAPKPPAPQQPVVHKTKPATPATLPATGTGLTLALIGTGFVLGGTALVRAGREQTV